MITFSPYPKRAHVRDNGVCWLIYVDGQGGFANDIWTFIRESDGGAVHVQTGQFNFCENPTLDISAPAGNPTQPK